MDVKDYISSGILERYVLGDVSSQELQEVACLSKIYPEIQEQLFAYQGVIEKMVLKYTVAPPENIKQKVLDKIKTTPQEHSNLNEKAAENDDKVIPINRVTPEKETGNYKFLAIAASIAMLIAVGTGFYINQENNQLQGSLTANQEVISDLKEEKDQIASQKESINQQFALVTSPNTAKIAMKGTEAQPTSLANVFVSEENGNVFLQVGNLPDITEENDYQLWAIVDGKPESLGVFNTENKEDLLQMKYFPKTQAYAVTLEPKGGSESPTMENMYVYGGV